MTHSDEEIEEAARRFEDWAASIERRLDELEYNAKGHIGPGAWELLGLVADDD